jgi:hypothetical protein
VGAYWEAEQIAPLHTHPSKEYTVYPFPSTRSAGEYQMIDLGKAQLLEELNKRGKDVTAFR